MEAVDNLDGLKGSENYKFEDDRFNEILSKHDSVKPNKKSKQFNSIDEFVKDFITDK